MLLTLPPTLPPQGPGEYHARVTLTSDRDTRVYAICVTVDGGGPAKALEMRAPLGGCVEQRIPVGNHAAPGPRAQAARAQAGSQPVTPEDAAGCVSGPNPAQEMPRGLFRGPHLSARRPVLRRSFHWWARDSRGLSNSMAPPPNPGARLAFRHPPRAA